MINSTVLRGKDARLVRESQLYPWQVAGQQVSLASPPERLSAETLEFLVPDNPQLIDLQVRYGRCDPTVTRPLVWVEGIVTQEDLKRFRSDNAFVYQHRGLQYNELGYALTAYYTQTAPEASLFDRMGEDGAFGAHVVEVGGRLVSRDLLDSAREIKFLADHVPAPGAPLSVLDIGAGYGRLAHRLTETLGDAVRVYATDAFPTSTFLAQFYLRQRNSPARVIPLDEFDAFIASTPLDVAVNVHSFSECTVEAIDWWVSRLAKHSVPNLMVIPNGEAKESLSPCRTNDGQDMEAIFARHGYIPTVREYRYADPIVRRYGIDPAQLNLFRLQ